MKGTHTTNLRFGHVTEYDPFRHMARVNFPDLGLTSWWLPVLVHNSLKNHDETHLDVGEHVACMMAGELGVVLGAFYDDKNTPPVKDSDTRAATFNDGTRVCYDRSKHELTITGPEKISADGEKIYLTSENTALNSSDRIGLTAENISLSAESISMSGGASGSAGITGRNVRITADNIPVTGKVITLRADSIIIDGAVSCPGYCHCGD